MNNECDNSLSSLISDAERCSFVYEDICNLLIILDDKLYEATHGVDPAKPWTVKASQNSMAIVRSLLTTILNISVATQKELSDTVNGLYSQYKTSHIQVTTIQ